jgi:hypothetical protein
VTPVARIPLDDRGRAFMIERLTGANALSDALAGIIESEGEVFAFVPAEAEPDQLYHFDRGGLSAAGRLGPELAAEFHAALSNSLVCVIDDVLSRPSDPRPLGDEAFFDCDDVYRLAQPSISAKRLADLMRYGNAHWHGMTVLCSHEPLIDAQRQTTLMELHACAESAVEVACIAYDGEGFVCWRR